MAAAMCGVQAQVLSAAEWSLGLRLEGATKADVKAAVLTDRSLVKTFGPRGTVHLLTASDLPIWTAAMAAIPTPPGSPHPAMLSPGQADAVLDAIAEALQGGEQTLDNLSSAVIAKAGTWAGDLVVPMFGGNAPRWQLALALAGMRGIACFGAGRGRRVTYASPATWLGTDPAGQGIDPATALTELVLRYLQAYGPATSAHFAQWLGVPRSWAAGLFGSLAGRLEPVDLAGQPAWLATGDTEPPAEPPAGVRLLPYFDAYVITGQPRDLLFPGAARARALNKTGQAGTLPVLLVDGTVAGVWHRRVAGSRLQVTVEPFDPLTPRRLGELDAEVARLGEFQAAAPALTIGQVSTGWHA